MRRDFAPVVKAQNSTIC